MVAVQYSVKQPAQVIENNSKRRPEMAKPTECPQCKNAYFHWDHESDNGAVYWKCNKCGFMIKD